MSDPLAPYDSEVENNALAYVQRRLDQLWFYVEHSGGRVSEKTMKELKNLQAIEDRYLEEERKKCAQPEVN